ncbi:PAS domain S-box protein [Anatilimnocola sp. NA78]|uniref:PAS domain S-box protein n=1 Tax=Anatilimnocola sp. NA78 TaxID=3415683 RepID=UPI003CE49D1C
MAPGARHFVGVLLFGIAYLGAILLGHALSFPQLNFATFWPAAGLLLATLAVCPRAQWWQFVFLASSLNIATEVSLYQQPAWLALWFAVANGCEACLGAACLRSLSGGPFQFLKLRDVLVVGAVALLAPLVGAGVGAYAIWLHFPAQSFWTLWQLWWQADSVGILLVCPVQIACASLLSAESWQRWKISDRRVLEAGLLLPLLFVVSCLAFGGVADSIAWAIIGLIYLAPGLAWAGLRLGRAGAAIASAMTVMICLYFTVDGVGLFALASPLPELQAMSFQSFTLVVMLTPMIFATVIDGRHAAEDQLRHNLNILQSVLNNTTDLIYVKDLEGRYLLMNQAGATLVHRPVSDIIGRLDGEIIPPQYADGVRQRDHLVFAAGHALTFEESVELDGKRHWFLTTKSPYRDAAGNIVGLVGLSRDVTQRVDQVEALAESERRYRTLVTSSNVGIYETDQHGACKYLNPRWCELTGRSSMLGEGDGWVDCLHPDDREAVNIAFQRAVDTGTEFEQEYRYLTPDGRTVWVYGTAVPIRDEQGQVTGFLGNVIDISDKKRALLELQSSEERFRRLADSAPVLIWTSTPAGHFSYCNSRWLHFTGRSYEQELGLGWLENVHPDDRVLCEQKYADAAASQSSFRLDYRLRRYDNEYRWMHHEGTPKLLINGEFRGFVGSCFDITDQRLATETLLRAKVELERHVAERTADLQVANSHLQQALIDQAKAEERLQQQQTELAHVSRLSVMGEMAAGLAHELNQPLFAIQNYTAGILRRWAGPQDFSPELRNIISQISQESTRAAVIVRRAREFARKQLGERTSLPLNSVIQEVLQLLGSEIRSQQVQIKLSLAEHLPTVLIDRVQIQQVLVNLIRNAMESMESLPKRERVLTITTGLATDEIQCQVRDSGPGISTDVRTRLFEPFFTTKQSGLGMGLSISRSIIEAHGGNLSTEPATNGATFHFSIPLLEEQAHDADHRHDADSILS